MKKVFKIIILLLNLLMTTIIVLGFAFIFLFILGIRPYVVQSGSMEPIIETGSICFVNKNIKYENIKKNDIIAFKMNNSILVTHRVISVTENGLETKGDSNEISDGISTTKENYIGKNIFSIPKVGYVIELIQSKNGKIIFITLIIILFLSSFLISKPNKGKHKKD